VQSFLSKSNAVAIGGECHSEFIFKNLILCFLGPAFSPPLRATYSRAQCAKKSGEEGGGLFLVHVQVCGTHLRLDPGGDRFVDLLVLSSAVQRTTDVGIHDSGSGTRWGEVARGQWVARGQGPGARGQGPGARGQGRLT
jgi:hypothetical protein